MRKLILNCRPLKHWLLSRVKHGYARQEGHLYPSSVVKLRDWIADRQRHHLRVVNYFRHHPSSLIIVDIHLPHWLNFLSQEAGLEFYDLHSNHRGDSFLPKYDVELFESHLDDALEELNIPPSEAFASCIIPDFEGAPDALSLRSLYKEMRYFL